MKTLYFMPIAFALTTNAFATTFKVTLTNGSNMGLSHGVLYSTVKSATDRNVGKKAPAGFVDLCRAGNADGRKAELEKNSSVKKIVVTDGLAPGESRTYMIDVPYANSRDLHFETMYGKSKDVCGVIDINRIVLGKLAMNYHLDYSGKDDVVRTGVYSSPSLPVDTADVCRDMSAVSCLRSLSLMRGPVGNVEFFRPYLPQVLNFLTERYGSDETDTLLIPTGGAIRFTVQRH